MSEKLVDLKRNFSNPIQKGLISLVNWPLEKSLAIDKLNDLYYKILQEDNSNYFDTCLSLMNINALISNDDLEKIPAKGPLIIVANHPFGGIEGIILGSILLRKRKDVKILGDYFLQRIKLLNDYVIEVTPFKTKKKNKKYTAGYEAAVDWVKNGGALITFPSAKVSFFQLSKMEVRDAKWSVDIAAMIRETKALVESMYIPGKNSLLYQSATVIPRLKKAFMPRELINKSNKTIPVYVSKPISWKKLQNYEDDKSLIRFLRITTYFLKNRERKIKSGSMLIPQAYNDDTGMEKIIPPVATDLLINEISNLPQKNMLIESGKFHVYYAESSQIPEMMREIGRLREITFRAAKEGTGKALDIDEYDALYLHLILWNYEKNELVGAYRLGKADEIINNFGLTGLYTSSLFKYKNYVTKYLMNALEVGRSFIRMEYQKTPSALSLLWRGIGEYIIQSKKYYKLFGPVSISQDYHAVSQDLIVQFIKKNRWHSNLSKYVLPRCPFKINNLSLNDKLAFNAALKDIDDVSLLISDLEKDGKGVPVLLRHYLKLNARLLCFNVDVNFMNVLDGLILVDLRDTDSKLLKRFMGFEGYEKFYEMHKKEETKPVSKFA